jgi:hypothetical protein
LYDEGIFHIFRKFLSAFVNLKVRGWNAECYSSRLRHVCV